MVHAGEACVFFNPKLLFGLIGHVGWGWETANSTTYVYGSDDGPTDNNSCGGSKNWLQAIGTRDDMISWFKGRNYSSYNCETVQNPVADAANSMITTVKNIPYYWAGLLCLQKNSSNCLDDTVAILGAYNAPGLQPATILNGGDPNPKTWFDSLGNTGDSSYGGSWSQSSITL
ncbi:2295_t:CDS:1, partial [Scutellospora calospora]